MFDGLGSTDRLVDVNAAVTDTYLYDAFGNVRGGTAPSTNPFRYVGRLGYYLDVDTSELYVRTRYYDSRAARFMSRDPLSLMSHYVYASSRPLYFVDPRGLADVPTAGLDPNCKGACGPDVTKWYYDDLKENYTRLSNEQKNSNAANYLFYFKNNAKYNLSYKWILFQDKDKKCASGKCVNTVTLGGTCIRKNQLGNIAFAYLLTAVPPVFVANANKLRPEIFGIEYGYEPGSTYDKDHPFSGNYGDYIGKQRADNLAAFSLGYMMGAGAGVVGDMGWLKMDEKNFAFMLQLTLSERGKGGTFDRYADLFGPNAKITGDALTFVPEFGGFNTRSCNNCDAVFKGPGSKASFDAIKASYKGDPDKFDDWLRQSFEDYSRRQGFVVQ